MNKDKAIALAQLYAKEAQGIVYIYSEYLVFDGENYYKSSVDDYEVTRASPKTCDGRLVAFVRPSGSVIWQ